MQHQTRIDSGPITHLALCSCAWRGLPTTDRLLALEQASAHEARCHTELDAARRATREHRRRHL